ncbi:MAG: hypothetical protein LUH05_03250 [Candidatus Gastranaerophilales bacterium]|nr:hypothetical protein [Candidatus Gastranaerophilales bacterium]
MTTELEAINTMLSCVGQSPINTLEGTKSYFTMMAENILKEECKRVLLEGWDFNTDYNYQLNPDVNNHISITDDMLLVQFPQLYRNRYVTRDSKLYDKKEHTYEITDPLKVKIIWNFSFDKLPENFKTYIKMSSAYKFCKRALGSETACIYTKEDVQEAYTDLLGYELETGNYTIIPEMRTRIIRGDI